MATTLFSLVYPDLAQGLLQHCQGLGLRVYGGLSYGPSLEGRTKEHASLLTKHLKQRGRVLGAVQGLGFRV